MGPLEGHQSIVHNFLKACDFIFIFFLKNSPDDLVPSRELYIVSQESQNCSFCEIMDMILNWRLCSPIAISVVRFDSSGIVSLLNEDLQSRMRHTKGRSHIYIHILSFNMLLGHGRVLIVAAFASSLHVSGLFLWICRIGRTGQRICKPQWFQALEPQRDLQRTRTTWKVCQAMQRSRGDSDWPSLSLKFFSFSILNYQDSSM